MSSEDYIRPDGEEGEEYFLDLAEEAGLEDLGEESLREVYRTANQNVRNLNDGECSIGEGPMEAVIGLLEDGEGVPDEEDIAETLVVYAMENGEGF